MTLQLPPAASEGSYTTRRDSIERTALEGLHDGAAGLIESLEGTTRARSNRQGVATPDTSPDVSPQVPQPAPEVLTADEVAVLLRLDRKTVYDAAKDGTLPCLRLGRVLRFHRQAVLDSMTQGRVAPAKGDT